MFTFYSISSHSASIEMHVQASKGSMQTVTQSCLTLCGSMDCGLPGSSVHGILQTSILEWLAISYSRGTSRHKDWTHVSGISCIGRQIFFFFTIITLRASLIAQLVKTPPAMQETQVPFLGWEDALEKGEATHSSILSWRIPWTEKSTGSQRVGHSWEAFTFTFQCHLESPWENDKC